MYDPNDETQARIAHNLEVQEISKTFKISLEAADKVVTLYTEMGLNLENIKTMSLAELQMRHGAYLLEKSQVEDQVEFYKEALDNTLTERQEELHRRYLESGEVELKPGRSRHQINENKEEPNRWKRLAEDLKIFEEREARQRKQEEMAYVREVAPENYANRAERRRILRENARKGKKR